MENALLDFERRLPSTRLAEFPATLEIIENSERFLQTVSDDPDNDEIKAAYKNLARAEREFITDYLVANRQTLSAKYNMTLTPSRIDVVAKFYARYIMDIGSVIRRVKSSYDDVKKIELHFYKSHDINVVLEDDAIDFIIELISDTTVTLEDFKQQMSRDFELGFKLIQEKTGKSRFFVTRKALMNPEAHLDNLIKAELKDAPPAIDQPE